VRSPVTIRLADISEEMLDIPDRPAVFLLWAVDGAPYLAKTTLLRRRLRRLLSRTERLTHVLRLNGVAERLEYWTVGSQLEAMLVHLELAKAHFPEDWQKITRLKAPAFVRLVTDNQFPRMMVTTRLGKGLFAGPFPSRLAAERYENEVLDLFQMRRCEENLTPTPEHPGCIYGEMNKCLRPCQAAVSVDEYRHEAERVTQFLTTRGVSLLEPAEAARDRASAELQFEEAERQHARIERIREVVSTAGDLSRPLEQLVGIAVVRSAGEASVELMVFAGGQWQEPRRLLLADSLEAGQSMDRRLREMMAQVSFTGKPNLEHLAILMRWYGSSWRDGEWVGFDAPDKVPYRRIVNSVARVAGPRL
jgi:excinuclease UvrABC nuclease subunit